MIKTRVYSILNDKKAKVRWKLEELNRLLNSSVQSFQENAAAVSTLQQHIKDYPESDEQEDWKRMLEANRHDAQVHQEHIDYIREAIETIKSATTGKQLDLFSG